MLRLLGLTNTAKLLTTAKRNLLADALDTVGSGYSTHFEARADLQKQSTGPLSHMCHT